MGGGEVMVEGREGVAGVFSGGWLGGWLGCLVDVRLWGVQRMVEWLVDVGDSCVG